MGKYLKYIGRGLLIAFSLFVLIVFYRLYLHWGDIPWGEIIDTPYKKARIFSRLVIMGIGIIVTCIGVRAFNKKAASSKELNSRLLDLGVQVASPSKIITFKYLGYFLAFYLLMISDGVAEFFALDGWVIEFFKLLKGELILPLMACVFAGIWFFEKLACDAGYDIEYYLKNGATTNDAVDRANRRLGYKCYEVVHNG